jgi:hypothetical protein
MRPPINLLIYFEYFESSDPTKADDDNCPAGLRRLAARRTGRPADSEKKSETVVCYSAQFKTEQT